MAVEGAPEPQEGNRGHGRRIVPLQELLTCEVAVQVRPLLIYKTYTYSRLRGTLSLPRPLPPLPLSSALFSLHSLSLSLPLTPCPPKLVLPSASHPVSLSRLPLLSLRNSSRDELPAVQGRGRAPKGREGSLPTGSPS